MENDDAEDVPGARRISTTLDAPVEWLSVEALAPVREANELLLEAVTVASHQPQCSLAEVHPLLLSLDRPSRRRLAGCPFLLLDAGFQDAARWREARRGRETVEPPRGGLIRTHVAELAHMTFVLAWSMARTHREQAQMLLGMSPECMNIIAELRLRELRRMASRHKHWVRPRWHARPTVWRRLIEMAHDDTINADGLRGFQYFLGDVVSIDP